MSNLTKQAIKNSFIKLLDERPLTRITVRDITQDCGINRNSFYYHYHDIPEVMEEIFRDRTDALIDAYPGISSLEECVEAAFHFVLENRRSINHIYHSLNREVFEQYLMRICDYTVSSWYHSAFSLHSSPALPKEHDWQRMIRFIRYELFGACIDFMNEGMPPEAIDEAKDLLRLALRVFPEPVPERTREIDETDRS